MLIPYTSTREDLLDICGYVREQLCLQRNRVYLA